MDVTHADLRSLAAEIRGEIREGHRALVMDLGAQVQTTRREITDRLDQLNGKVGDAHQRITKVEAVVGFLSETVQTMRKRVHEMGGRVQHWIARLDGREDRDGARVGDGHVRWTQLKQIIALVGATVTATTAVILWVLKLVGKI